MFSRVVFGHFHMKLVMIIVYHSQGDGQSKGTDQTADDAPRYFLAKGDFQGYTKLLLLI